MSFKDQLDIAIKKLLKEINSIEIEAYGYEQEIDELQEKVDLIYEKSSELRKELETLKNERNQYE